MSISVHSTEEATSLEADVDQDITAFEEWFSSHVENGPLVHAERAILKTYLWWKFKGTKQTGG